MRLESFTEFILGEANLPWRVRVEFHGGATMLELLAISLLLLGLYITWKLFSLVFKLVLLPLKLVFLMAKLVLVVVGTVVLVSLGLPLLLALSLPLLLVGLLLWGALRLVLP